MILGNDSFEGWNQMNSTLPKLTLFNLGRKWEWVVFQSVTNVSYLGK